LPSNQWTRVIFDVYKIVSAQDYYVFISDKSIKRLQKEQNEIKKYIQENKNNEYYHESFTNTLLYKI
jgi:ribosomal silencing factor RsfS